MRPVRPTVRLRLTLLYGGLFLLAGALLLVVNYGLVRSRLLAGPAAVELRDVPPGLILPDDNLVVAEVLAPPEPDSPEARRIREAFERGAEELQRTALQELVVQSGIALSGMALVSVGLGWWIAGRVLRPLHRITATARRLSEQNLHERIALDGPEDELKELADTFDAMLARLDASFEGQRRFIANASHELRTPLAIQRTLVDVALADPDESPARRAKVADDLRAAIERSERLIDGLLLLARSERQVERWERTDLGAAVTAAAAAVAAEAAERGVRVDVAPSPAVAHGDPALLERAVANLIENAVRHNVAGGWAVATTTSSEGRARVFVENTGPVLAEEDVPQLCEPFRRRSERVGSAEGSGLGLSIVRSIAQTHDGELRIRPRAGGGLEAELLLPAPRGGATSPRTG